MPTADKARQIEQAKEWYSKSSGVVFADYRGLSVKQLQGLRRDLRAKGAELHVLKNTLFRIAAGEDINSLPAEYHNGTTAFAFVYENESDVAKTLLDFARTSKKLVVKGGLFGGKPMTDKQVQSLSELPPRDVLIAQVIGTIAAPISNLIGTIEALYADPIRVIGAVADKVGEGSGAVEATSTPAPAPADEAPAAESAPEAAPAASEGSAPAEEAPAAESTPEEAPAASEEPAPAEEAPAAEETENQ
ncbi:MAG TPA: 50S ribosomal protein L10 [Fimbriimonas sp.]|nr:50S ribosomal protein L10 [Fimbriimonas sp.]